VLNKLRSLFRRKDDRDALIDALTVRSLRDGMDILELKEHFDSIKDDAERLVEINTTYVAWLSQERARSCDLRTRLDAAVACLETIVDVLHDERSKVPAETQRILCDVIADELDEQKMRPMLRLVQ
jgi:hypothetical protein